MTLHCGRTEWAIQRDVDHWESGNVHLHVWCPGCDNEKVDVEQVDDAEMTEGLVISCGRCSSKTVDPQPALGQATDCDCGPPE